MKTFNTVIVMEIPNVLAMTSIMPPVAYPDDAEGNNAAEAHFRSLVWANVSSSNRPTDDEMAEFIENGIWQAENYCIMLVHSGPPEKTEGEQSTEDAANAHYDEARKILFGNASPIRDKENPTGDEFDADFLGHQ